ncbi:MAG: hypothetical protein ACU837_17460 [Gammaproteobacteria bacterium]
MQSDFWTWWERFRNGNAPPGVPPAIWQREDLREVLTAATYLSDHEQMKFILAQVKLLENDHG